MPVAKAGSCTSWTRAAASPRHTGSDCVDWCGHVEGDGFSIAGNMLAGAAVLDDTAQAYLANEKLPFAQRLIAAMRAGEAAGGDKRGKQSAALLIYGEEEWSDSICVSTTTPIRWPSSPASKQVSRERWVHFRHFMPTRKNPAGDHRPRDHRRRRRGRHSGGERGPEMTRLPNQ